MRRLLLCLPLCLCVCSDRAFVPSMVRVARAQPAAVAEAEAEAEAEEAQRRPPQAVGGTAAQSSL